MERINELSAPKHRKHAGGLKSFSQIAASTNILEAKENKIRRLEEQAKVEKHASLDEPAASKTGDSPSSILPKHQISKSNSSANRILVLKEQQSLWKPFAKYAAPEEIQHLKAHVQPSTASEAKKQPSNDPYDFAPMPTKSAEGITSSPMALPKNPPTQKLPEQSSTLDNKPKTSFSVVNYLKEQYSQFSGPKMEDVRPKKSSSETLSLPKTTEKAAAKDLVNSIFAVKKPVDMTNSPAHPQHKAILIKDDTVVDITKVATSDDKVRTEERKETPTKKPLQKSRSSSTGESPTVVKRPPVTSRYLAGTMSSSIRFNSPEALKEHKEGKKKDATNKDAPSSDSKINPKNKKPTDLNTLNRPAVAISQLNIIQQGAKNNAAGITPQLTTTVNAEEQQDPFYLGNGTNHSAHRIKSTNANNKVYQNAILSIHGYGNDANDQQYDDGNGGKLTRNDSLKLLRVQVDSNGNVNGNKMRPYTVANLRASASTGVLNQQNEETKTPFHGVSDNRPVSSPLFKDYNDSFTNGPGGTEGTTENNSTLDESSLDNSQAAIELRNAKKRFQSSQNLYKTNTKKWTSGKKTIIPYSVLFQMSTMNQRRSGSPDNMSRSNSADNEGGGPPLILKSCLKNPNRPPSQRGKRRVKFEIPFDENSLHLNLEPPEENTPKRVSTPSASAGRLFPAAPSPVTSVKLMPRGLDDALKYSKDFVVDSNFDGKGMKEVTFDTPGHHQNQNHQHHHTFRKERFTVNDLLYNPHPVGAR